MKIKMLFFLLSFLSAGAALAAGSDSITAELAPAYEILTQACKADLLENAEEAFEDIEAVRASMADQLQNGGYGNSIQGYFILSAIFAENPYRGLNALESGIKRLQKEKRPSRYQQIILQTYCENGGEVSMQLITIAP